MPSPISIDVFSDPICPWCYIGLQRLEGALAAINRQVRMHWRCFMLNPEMPLAGMDRQTYLERKFGGPSGAQRVYATIEAAATQAGLSLDFSRIRRTPSTVLAHMALREAQIQHAETNQAEAFVRGLFAAYFERGQDIGQRQVLHDLWAAAGLSPARLDQVFDQDLHRDHIAAENRDARSRGISGVPFFIVAGTYALAGAQDQAALQRVFDLVDQGQAHEQT